MVLLSLVGTPARALRGVALPVIDALTQPGDEGSKIDGVTPDKLPRIGKVKECCGYPVAMKEGFRLSFYWLAYEAEYANEDYDTDIYTKQGYFIGRYPSAFVYELKLEGSGILRDGRVLNYAGECNYGMGTCFKTLTISSTRSARACRGGGSSRSARSRSIQDDPDRRAGVRAGAGRRADARRHHPRRLPARRRHGRRDQAASSTSSSRATSTSSRSATTCGGT